MVLGLLMFLLRRTATGRLFRTVLSTNFSDAKVWFARTPTFTIETSLAGVAE